jgi:hypothetical protein
VAFGGLITGCLIKFTYFYSLLYILLGFVKDHAYQLVLFSSFLVSAC